MNKNLEFSNLLDFYGAILTDKQREALEYYYNEDLSLSEISENLCITRQGVHDLIKRAEAEILMMEEKLQFFAKSQYLRFELNNIYKNLEQVLLLDREDENIKVFVQKMMRTVKTILES